MEGKIADHRLEMQRSSRLDHAYPRPGLGRGGSRR
ncbi:hypothetical protein CASFOL_038768 [Castilleja foliolosa]|uniref:Uncharacterized protein n=1 Tax=Castilleja foliolosa TaxID=1961234 RepID=A0ABD3BIS6_9LAMI